MTRALDPDRIPRTEAVARLADLSPAISERAESIELKNQLVESIAHERERLAQHLHDTLAQHLTAACIHARLASKKLQTTPESGVLDELERVIESAADELQFVMRLLRSPEFDQGGLVPALTELVAFASAEVPIQLVAPSAIASASRASELQLLRAVQLTLLEVVRRRAADSVAMTLRAEDGELVLTIDEFGTDRSLRSSEALLAAEVAALGGTFETLLGDAIAERGVGRRIVCRVPKRL